MSEDHPRLRGEKESDADIERMLSGSPPLARGKASTPWIPMMKPRITPACAGKSYELHLIETGHRDHPRLRGEKTKKILLFRPFLLPVQWISFSLKNNCSISSQSFGAR